MKKEILIALVCAGLMFVTPLTGVAQENKVSRNLTDKPDVVELVAQIKVVIDEILEKYGHIPMVKGLCNVIINSLGLIGNIIICILLILILIPFGILALFFGLVLKMQNIGMYFASICFVIVLISGDYCSPYNTPISRPPFKSINTLSETNDILDFNDCPCLQE